MAKSETLKEKNTPLLWTFFIFNIIIFILLFFATYFDELTKDYKTLFSLRSSGILIAPLILFIINGILSSEQKAVLAFWRLKFPLPGARAFTRHAPKDSRINMKNLQAIHGTLPISEREQNSLWYGIYKKHSKDSAVAKSHKDFLLARDISSIAFLFILLIGIPTIFWGVSPLNWIYLACLTFQYFVFCIITQNHGKRFVTNVLALESAAPPQKSKKGK